MKSFLKLERVIILATLVATLLASCTPANLFSSPTPAPPSSPTLTLTSTSTPSPTPTETLTPTPTKELTPEQQRERDYGALVPKDEMCVRETELFSNFKAYMPTDIVVAELKVHATDNIKTVKIPMGRDKVEREVTMLQVVCRDAGGDIAKPMWLVLGGSDFGENKDGTNIFWFSPPDGGSGQWVTTIDVILQNIPKGLEIRVRIPTKKSASNLVDRPFDEGATNELANEALRQFDANQEQVKLILEGQSVSQDDFILIPLMIKLGPFNSP